MHVVAATIRDAHGRVLIAQRRTGTHLAGAWEFPGGKIEPGETRPAGLARELAEEIGIRLTAAHPLIRVYHAYPGRDIDLDVWMVTAYEGVAHGREGQPVRWCSPEDLPTANLMPADRPIITALSLPEAVTEHKGRNYVIGDSAGGRFLRGAFCSNLPQALAAVAAGADFLLVHGVLDPVATSALASKLNVPIYVYGVSPEAAWECGASGTHTLKPP